MYKTYQQSTFTNSGNKSKPQQPYYNCTKFQGIFNERDETSKKSLDVPIDGIRVKGKETPEEYLDPVKSNDLDSQFDPGRLFCRSEIGLGKAYEVWKKKVEKFKRITGKSEGKNLNELEKHIKYEQITLDYMYETWMNKVNKLKRTIKYLYKLKDPKRCKIADLPNTETLEKDKNQSIQL
ncbi:hypothetical protein F8M41_024806 [Gigaspora margarita]|uniref:Uncharacterized protein n=1 Tax=Gigaspora margarita TaxID=4874 RepID=A0A8H4B0A8_GIGMA|nr:hypothetical protein F8M41_024806 [Gigaspora margarita]